MEVEFADPELDRLETDPKATAGHGSAVDRGFRKAMQALRAAHDDRDLYANRGLHFEKLKGDRSHQRSVRINKQWRLILEIAEGESGRRIRIVAIENHYGD